MKKVLIGGIVGGIVMFIWGAVAHMLLPLGHMGVSNLPKEEAVLTSLKESITQPGLYYFPGKDMTRELSQEEKDAWDAKHKAGPTGILVYNPTGSEPMSTIQLATQLAIDLVAALVAAILLAQVSSGFAVRLIFMTLLGLFAWLTLLVPYWNWYGFPQDFVIAGLMKQVAGWFLAGIALAAIVKSSPKPEAKPAPR